MSSFDGRPLPADTGDRLARAPRAASPDRIALTDAATGEDVSYRAWNERVNRTANCLVARGVRRGDRVAVRPRQRVDVLDLWLACGKIGAVAQMLNVRLTSSELAAQLSPPPRLLVHGNDEASWASLVGLSLHAGGATTATLERVRVVSVGRRVRQRPLGRLLHGGSTGAPRGAILTHGSIGTNAFATVKGWGIRPDDSTVLAAPLLHVDGVLVLTAPLLLAGGRSIVCDRFDAGDVLEPFANARVSPFFGVPTMHLALCRHSQFAKTDLSGLRFVVSGGAP